MDIALLILLVLFLTGGIGWHYRPQNSEPAADKDHVLGVILVIALVLALAGYIGPHYRYW